MEENKHKHSMRLSDELWAEVQAAYRADGCSTINQRAAEQGHEYAQFFLDHMNEPRTPSVMLAATRLLYHLGNIFRDNEPSEAAPGTIQIDHKRRQEMLGKRIALGHKPDDHEDQSYSGMSMAAPW